MDNITDKDLEREVDARIHSSGYGDEKLTSSGHVDRPTSAGTTGSSIGSSSSIDYNSQRHRMQSRNTELDLERNRSQLFEALSRIETQRLQHALTVGESVRSRPSKGPLPAFGGGKEYPPQLPNREDYVVEFDGSDDPLYPQNWPLSRK